MGLRVGSGISEGRECKGEAGWSPAVMAEGVEEGGDLRFTPLGEVRGVVVAGPYPGQELWALPSPKQQAASGTRLAFWQSRGLF